MTNPFQQFFRRVIIALAILLTLLSVGTAGYRWLEGLSLIDALYMTVITISTVGFGEIHSLSPAGRLFTIALIIGGGGLAAFSLSAMADYFFSGEWRRHWEARRRLRMLKELSNHVIVCGFGRVGRHVSDELRAEGIPFVVLDIDLEQVAHAERNGYLVITGNAANEATLQKAGIQAARALVAAVNSDAENVFITLTARALRPDLCIVARANYEDSEPKLRRAGADRIILPYQLSGKRMVTSIVRPGVLDFLDEVVHAGGMELLLEQLSIHPKSALAGKTLVESQIAGKVGATVIACRARDGSFSGPSGPNSILEPGSQIIVLGTREQLKELMKLTREP